MCLSCRRLLWCQETEPLDVFWIKAVRMSTVGSLVIHVHYIKFNNKWSPDSIREIEDDIQFELMGPDKLPKFGEEVYSV